MPILTTEIVWNKSAMVSDITPAQNGGRFTNTAIPSGVKNNLFPDVSSAQRLAGIEHWRKAFVTLKSANNLPLIDAKVSIEVGTPGDSYVLLHVADWTDTQADTASRPYGYGVLASAVAGAETELSITTEADFSLMTDKPFQVGDVIRVDARADVLSTGVSEYVAISAVSYSGATLTVTLFAPLVNSYAAGARVASVIEPGAEMQTAVVGKATTGGTTYNDVEHPIIVPQIGAIYQTWTITVTDASGGALSVSGDTVGTIGTGAVGANLSPSNPAGGTYFTVESAGWGGTRTNGDTLTFSTQPAAIPLWYHRIVPAGATAISSDPVSVCVEGESA